MSRCSDLDIEIVDLSVDMLRLDIKVADLIRRSRTYFGVYPCNPVFENFTVSCSSRVGLEV